MNAGIGERTDLGVALEECAKEILAHVKGEKRRPTRRVVPPGEVDVKRIRKSPHVAIGVRLGILH